MLTRRQQSRIFQQQTVPQILEAVFKGLDVQLDLLGRYEPRNYCVQYRESDFAFVSRLMEEEGIFYFFTHADGAHKMVVADQPDAHKAVPGGAIPFRQYSGGVRPDDAIYSWQREQTLTAGKVVLWDDNFEMPGRNHAVTASVRQSVVAGTVAHKLAIGGNDKLELYDYPGGYAKRFDGVDPGGGDRASDLQNIAQDNDRTVKLRMQAEEARAVTTEGASTCRQLVAGHKLTLTGHENADGTYVLIELQHEARAGDVGMSGSAEGFEYKNRFVCVPASVPVRPARTTPRPEVAGCQTATVVGPRGEEIYVDKYGRVKVQFHWDRDGKRDANSSCWVRVATPWAGKKWGAVHLPRIGQEVVVDFLEGDPDRPIIVGSVYNAEQLPPYVLPANKTQSGVKSRSSPQGGDDMFNEMRFEDKKGSEHLHVQAQKDLSTLVKNDETRDVLHDRTTTIKNDETLTVTDGNQKITVSKGDRTLDVTQGKQTTTVFGNETFTVKQGNRTVEIQQGNDALTISMGNLTIGVKMGNVAIKADLGKITLEAMQGIELKVGQSTVKLDQTGITTKGIMIKSEATAIAEFKGAMVKVEGQGMTQVKAPMTQINGDGLLMAKGGITMIN
jgi:type VI secretion system secreted protein VgrG